MPDGKAEPSALPAAAATGSLSPAEQAFRVRLDDLVTRVAVSLMPVSAATLHTALVEALREVATCFDVDTSFLRSNDLSRELSVLVAEWPARPDVPDPDPLGAVPFEADPVFAASRELREPLVVRPQPGDYQERVQQGSGVQQVSMACVPLLGNDVTLGVLGFVKFGDRPWATAEINALQAVASLIVQLQARVAAEEKLRYSADHDDLTGLANRRALLRGIERRWAQGPASPVALVSFDIDRFGAMNDFLGQAAGDRLLAEVAQRLQAHAGPNDLVARLDGDEFVVLVGESTDEVPLAALGERWLQVMASPLDVGGHSVTRSASVGIVCADPAAIRSADALAHAHAAMQAAKAQGGDRAVIFDDDMRCAAKERMATEMLLRQAIANEGLELHYQPEIDIVTGELLAVEALVRWRHPSRGLLAASEFIEIAEAAGLVVELGRFVVAEACRQLAEWRTRHPHLALQMRINMSPAQLASRDIVDLVASCLRDNGVPGRLVCLEITEYAVMQDVKQAVETLHLLKALGVTLAIDDFGTGFCSMSYLKQLPVDALKIDRTFVIGLPEDGGDRAIVSATVALAEAFGLEVVAEGVETDEVVTQLVDLGCHRAQGYLLSRPKPPAELESMLAAGGLDWVRFAPNAALYGSALPDSVATLWPGRNRPRYRDRLAAPADGEAAVAAPPLPWPAPVSGTAS